MKTVVVIDDEYAIVETLVDVLELHGYACVTASNGQEGLELIKQKHPDLVITDLMMPIMDGGELVAALRSDSRFRELPIILTSAAQHPTGLASEPESRFVYIRKPFSVSELLYHIRRLTEHDA
jgi:CheY-like chemotaxis protein